MKKTSPIIWIGVGTALAIAIIALCAPGALRGDWTLRHSISGNELAHRPTVQQCDIQEKGLPDHVSRNNYIKAILSLLLMALLSISVVMRRNHRLHRQVRRVRKRHRQTSHALTQSEKLVKSIIDAMPSILISVDAEGRVMQWNHEAEQATGISAQRALGQPLHQVFTGFGEELNQVIKILNDHQLHHHEHLHCTMNQTPHIVNVTIYPITADGSEGAVIRVDDVTDQVHIEEMMMQSEKMMSIGGLAAGMAHEINNPLAGILQSLQVINNRITQETERNTTAAHAAGTSLPAIRKYMESRDLLRMMDTISDAGHRAARIVDNMLCFSRKAESHFESNRLEKILEQSIELAANDYNLKKRFDFRHIRIKRDYSSALPAVQCEGSQIQQVMLNLLSNSAQAMAQNPKHATKDRITLRLKRDGAMALIEIEDNGPGMSTEIRKRIFEPFFTTKEVGQGTGLGLSVSYFIITETHHGTLRVTSTEGKGSCFSIRIPITHTEEPQQD